MFAGKDILAKIPQTPGLPHELKNTTALVERVLLALEASDAAPHTWLPEWAALHTAVQAWIPRP